MGCAAGVPGRTDLDLELDQSIESRRSILRQAKAIGGKEGAEFAHKQLSPLYWGVSLQQLESFITSVRSAVQAAELTNSTPAHLPQYPMDKFADAGPNMHQVNAQLIKPRTGADASPLPFVSYAVLRNPAAGVRCDCFISHAWDEGAFEFGRSAAAAWPSACQGAYICFLANPQNLDISELVSNPKTSPFYRVLEAGPSAMLMLANSNTPIHARLWCVFEAYCATTMGIPVTIAGDALNLVPQEARANTEQALAGLFRAEKDHALAELGCGATAQSLHPSDEVGMYTQRLRMHFDEIHLEARDAKCSSEEDAAKIWAEIVGSESDVNSMIKNQMFDAVVRQSRSSKKTRDTLLEQLQKTKNEHHSKSFRGFGHGARYDASEEARTRLAEIAELEKQIAALASPVVEELSGLKEDCDSAQESCRLQQALKSNLLVERKCLQCGEMFREKDNSATACRYHTAGGGQYFDWDEDDFLYAHFACCSSRDPNASGCRTGFHNSEEGRLSSANAHRNWSTAHM